MQVRSSTVYNARGVDEAPSPFFGPVRVVDGCSRSRFGRITEDCGSSDSSEGSTSSMRATTPEASGVAMLVPS